MLYPDARAMSFKGISMQRRLFAITIAQILSVFICGCVGGSQPKKSVSDKETTASKIESKELFDGGFATNNLLSVLVARNELWVGTERGLFTFHPKTLKPYESYLSGEKVVDLAVGASGTIYAAVEDRGLYYLPPAESKFYATQGGKPRKIFVAEGTDDVYCATANGIGLWSNSMWQRIEIPPMGEFASRANDVTSLAFDKKGTLWIGTNFGLYRRKAGSYEFLYGNYQIIQGNSVVNHAGNSPLGGNLFFDISVNPEHGGLMFSTNGGLSLLKNPDNYKSPGEWQTLTGDHTQTRMDLGRLVEHPIKGNSPLPSNFIKTAYGYGDLVLIGTDSGLFLLKDGKFEKYGLENQLAGDTIHDLYHQSNVDSDVIYVATNGGLSILTRMRDAQ